MKPGLANKIFKRMRGLLSEEEGMRTKHGIAFALDILAANGVAHMNITDDFGNDILISTKDKVISTSLIRDGEYSLEIMRTLVERMQAAGLAPGDFLFVNAGANIGTTIINAKNCGFVQMLAIEPDPSNFKLLTHNTGQLSDAAVTLKNVAVGREEGELILYRHPTNHGMHSMIPPEGVDLNESAASDDTAQLRVAVKPLSSLIDEGKPFVLFGDVEGYELPLLQGGITRIKENCQAMCLELTPVRYDAETAQDLTKIFGSFSDSYFNVETGESLPVSDLSGALRKKGAGQFDAIFLRRIT